MNIDSSSFGQRIYKSWRIVQQNSWEMYIRDPPAEDSVDVYSIL